MLLKTLFKKDKEIREEIANQNAQFFTVLDPRLTSEAYRALRKLYSKFAEKDINLKSNETSKMDEKTGLEKMHTHIAKLRNLFESMNKTSKKVDNLYNNNPQLPALLGERRLLVRENKYANLFANFKNTAKKVGIGFVAGIAMSASGNVMQESIDKVSELDINRPTVSTSASIDDDVTSINTDIDSMINASKEEIASTSIIEDYVEPNFDYFEMGVDETHETNSKAILDVKEEYGDLIAKYAKQYGIDENMMITIAAQESSGIHTEESCMRGLNRKAGIGLMQVESTAWIGKSVTAYNFETGKNETTEITKEKLFDVEQNVKIGCQIFQSTVSEFKNYVKGIGEDIPCNPGFFAGLYNSGINLFKAKVNDCSEKYNISKKEILENPDILNVNWANEHGGKFEKENGSDTNYAAKIAKGLINTLGVSQLNFRNKNSNDITVLNINNSYSKHK